MIKFLGGQDIKNIYFNGDLISLDGIKSIQIKSYETGFLNKRKIVIRINTYLLIENNIFFEVLKNNNSEKELILELKNNKNLIFKKLENAIADTSFDEEPALAQVTFDTLFPLIIQ